MRRLILGTALFVVAFSFAQHRQSVAAVTFAPAQLSLPVEMWPMDGSIWANPVPTWQNGFLLSHQGNSNVQTKVFAFDRTGKKVLEAVLKVEGAATVSVATMAASPSEIIAVSGGLNSAPNTGWIAWLSAPDRIDRLIMTAPFIAHQLCFGPDGTIWAAGLENGPEVGPLTHSYDVFRHYGENGQLLASFLQNETFGKAPGSPALLSHLQCSADRLGFYSQTANQWVELLYTGQLLGRWPGIGSYPDLSVQAAGITSKGVLISSQQRIANGTRLAYYGLDKTSGAWHEVQTSSGTFYGHILGTDRDGFVMHGGGRLVWTQWE